MRKRHCVRLDYHLAIELAGARLDVTPGLWKKAGSVSAFPARCSRNEPGSRYRLVCEDGQNSMDSETLQSHIKLIGDVIALAAKDESLVRCRHELAQFSSEHFLAAGTELHVLGHIIGSDRADGVSPFGHGSDETVAVSVLLRIASQLISASADLFADGRQYAAAALLRQMVEIEYLAWAFETRDGDGERWLRSDRHQRQSFFQPAKLRKAAQGKFRGKDYGYHCELGGHPVPKSGVLLDDDTTVSQLLLADLLGHVGRIWDHLVGWARTNQNGGPILKRGQVMSDRFNAWKLNDPMVDVPPPP